MSSKHHLEHALRKIVFVIALLTVLFIVLFPYTWAVVTSFKYDQQIRTGESLFIPRPFILDHYKEVLFNTPFLVWYRNSLFLALGSALVGIAVGAPAGYALARFRFWGSTAIATTVMIMYVIPTTLLFIPFMVLLNGFGLINSLWGALLVYTTITVPFCTWILLGFFRSIPEELGECALLDGCSRLGAFFRIELPLAQSGLIAVALFSFNLAWMEYIYSLTLLTNDAVKTLPVGIAQLQIGDVFPWGNLMAAAVMTSLPVVVLFVLLQRYFISGLTAGAVKS